MTRKSYEGSPDVTLNAVSRDPIVFFGCSMAEIQKTAALAFLIVFIPVMIALSFIHFAIGIFGGFISWFLVTRIYLARLAKRRSDRPLFYDQHYAKMKKGVFIKPNENYQRIKNID